MTVDPAELLAALTIPAAHQRSAIRPSRQRLTVAERVRQMEIMLSMALAIADGTPDLIDLVHADDLDESIP